MKLKYLPILILSTLLLFNCNKEVGITQNQYIRRLAGEWNIVNYKVNNENALMNQNFFTTQYSFYLPKQSSSLIFFVDCIGCPVNNMDISFNYTNGFRVSSLRHQFSVINTDKNPFSYPLKSDTNYETYWKIRKLTKRIMRIDNLDIKNRVEDIEMVLEK